MYDDGTITIGTSINSKGIEKDLNKLQRELEKYDKEYNELLEQKATISYDVESFEKLKQEFDEANEKAKEMQRLFASTDQLWYNLEAQKAEEKSSELLSVINKQSANYEKQKAQLEEINGLIEQNKSNQINVKSSYDQQLVALKEIGAQEQKIQAQQEKQAEHEASINKKISAFKRLGLALIGVGSIYGLVRKMARSFLNSNEETANAFKQIWANIMEFLQPYIEKVMNWLLKLVAYINVFVKAITGGKLDLTKNMNKNKKSIDGTTKSMKELNNQMTQFDEATKLQDNRSLDSGATAGGTNPFDGIENQLNTKIVQTLETIGNWVHDRLPAIKKAFATAFNFIKDNIGEILLIIGGLEIAKWVLKLGDIIGVAGNPASGIAGTGLLGIAALLGLIATYKTWEGVGEADAGLSKDNANLKDYTKTTEKSKNAIQKVVNTTKKQNLTEQQVATTTQDLNSKINDNIAVMTQSTKTLGDMGVVMLAVEDRIKGENSTLETNNDILRHSKLSIYEYIDSQEALRKSGQMTEEQMNEYRNTLLSARSQIQGLRDEYGRLPSAMNDVDGALQLAILRCDDNAQAVDNLIEKIQKYNNTPMESKQATVEITTVENITNIATKISRAIADAMATMKLKMQITNGVNGMVMNFQKLFAQKGALINLPGRGVPVGNGVYGGENGVEGVVPLTDSQAMQTLAEIIGRNVTINATIVNSMNGRVISRELQKINNEETFMYNR